MSLIRLVFLLATVWITLTRSQDPEISSTNLDVTQPPIKLDKNLRRALLKALTDLEAESAEQYKDESETISQRDTSAFEGIAKKNLNDNLGVQKTTFSFKSFPGDDDVPSEDKLQNSSFVEGIRYVTLNTPSMNIEKATQEDARSFHVQNVILPEKKSNFRSESKEQREKTPATMNIFPVNKMESLTQKPADVSESLTRSASNSIANALVSPKPTVVTPTVSTKNNVTITELDDSKDKTEEVKIFQAPLVAAFTVQQDEQGVPKSVVPIFRSPNDGQALTLQEQLEFKQQLLEKQLAELQQQQFQQTQFLVRQQQLYEQQLRQKQQQQYYLQEQVRIKQLEEQTKLKQLEEQRLKQLEEQRLNRFQLPPVPQKQFFFDQSNNFLTFQPPVESNVHLQPSLTLEVPNVAAPPTFQPIFQQDSLRLQPFRQQQQSQYLHQQQQIQPQQLQQSQQQHQRLQQSFGSFSTDFQPSVSTRFNRQEAFNLVGNFGFNGDNKIPANRGNFGFVPPHRTPANFYNPYAQFKQSKPPTPARQIQHLLYQSGIAGDPNNVQGIGNPEDLNIVSKVLALNVGAVPNKNLQFATNPGSRSLGKNSA
ncbi:TOX high mobility group box family member 3-like isoform X2 [Apis mellifera]|uniref:TOX high mobility group box family member 3-like isoform X2 n=1 Tax=Apis mellifera TaxID=7460 RepID=A0A7M7SRE1_APIME|nr:TOX high mobility group box family member 3-like isoform X2 [Apis mellifera]|eukprot:XP_026300099.1 TOX high mobility group box family member 3-like isoform X2 [Apis mellifera]